jgi:hypothetical protein
VGIFDKPEPSNKTPHVIFREGMEQYRDVFDEDLLAFVVFASNTKAPGQTITFSTSTRNISHMKQFAAHAFHQAMVGIIQTTGATREEAIQILVGMALDVHLANKGTIS